jgi:hypothetical protein
MGTAVVSSPDRRSLPPRAKSLNELPRIALHLANEIRWGGGPLMAGRPNDHLDDYRGEVKTFACQVVDELATVRRIRSTEDQPFALEELQAVGEDIRGDCLARRGKVAEAAVVREQEVADDEQRPPVPEDV